jgi:hypothetical protein
MWMELLSPRKMVYVNLGVVRKALLFRHKLNLKLTDSSELDTLEFFQKLDFQKVVEVVLLSPRKLVYVMLGVGVLNLSVNSERMILAQLLDVEEHS